MTKKNRSRFQLLLFVLIFSIFAHSGFSQTFTWTGSAGNSDWHNGGNWDQSGNVPATGDDVVIPDLSVDTVTFSTGTTNINSLTVSGTSDTLEITGGTLDVAATSTINGNLTISGGTLQGDGDINVSGKSTWSGTSTVSGSGSWNANGGLDLNVGTETSSDTTWTLERTLVIDGTSTWDPTDSNIKLLTTTGGGSITNNGDLTLSPAGGGFGDRLDINVPFTNSATGTITKTVTSNNAGFEDTFHNDGGSITSMDSTFVLFFSGGSTQEGSIHADGGGFSFFNSTPHDFNTGSSVTGTGKIRISSGTSNFNGGTYDVGITELANTPTVTYDIAASTNTFTDTSTSTLGGSGSLTVTNTWNSNSGATVDGNLILDSSISKTFNGFTLNGSGTITMPGTLSISSGTNTFNPTFSSLGTLNITKGTLNQH